MKNGTLLFGCFLGELGWEVATWIPAMRHVAHKFDRVVAIIRPEYRYLYEDFVDKFEYYDKKGKRDRWLLNGKKVFASKKILRKYPGVVYYNPSKEKCTRWKREYFRYGGETYLHPAFDLIIHARHLKKGDWIDKRLGRSRDWPLKNYIKLIKELNSRLISPLVIASIGTKAYHVPGTINMLNIPISRLCLAMANSKLMIGTSSGPSHLASLCGCPHIVITGNEKHKSLGGGRNRDRYKTNWNSFRTRVKILDKNNWNPSVETVLEAVEAMQ